MVFLIKTMKFKIIILLLFLSFLQFGCIEVVFDEEEMEEVWSADTLTIDRWEGHAVALGLSEDGKQAKLLLVSLQEWEPSDESYADYVEKEITDWHIPTKDEANIIRKQLGGEKVTPFLQLLQELDGDPLSLDLRYYCDQKAYTFSFKDGTVISKAGVSTKNYRIRLVKNVNVPMGIQ